MEVVRAPGSIETAVAIAYGRWPMNLVVALSLSPAPGPDRMRAALDAVQRRHPALRAGLARGRNDWGFAYGDTPSIPLHVVEQAGPGDWIAAAEHGLNTPVATGTGPLMEVTLLRHGAGDLVLTFHHAIADAAGAANLIGEILGACAGREAGPPLDVPPAGDDLFPVSVSTARRVGYGLRALLPEARYRLGMRRGGPTLDPAARTQIHPERLDAATTTALSREARRRRLTMTSVVHAAALRSVHLHRHGARPVRLRTFAFPDLRPFLRPLPAPESLACYMAMTWADVPMAAGGEGLWVVARNVQRRIEESVRRGRKFLAATMAPQAMRTVIARRLRMGNVAVSHTGTVPLAARHGPVAVRAVHAFVSNLAVGPEFTVRSGVFGGRLALDCITLDTDMGRAGMEALAGDVAATLAEAAGVTTATR